jgi:ABC-type transport system involved in multi-copper enzyme maturation permease subunit
MIGNIHLKQTMKGLRFKVILLCVGLFVFEMLFCIVGTSQEVQTSILRDLDDIPPLAQKMMGEGFIDALVKYGLIAIGYMHPFMIILFIILIFIIASQMITSEISGGTIGFTLSKAVSRKRIYFNFAVTVYGGLFLMAFSTYFASFLGIGIMYGDRLTAGPFPSLALNLFLIMALAAGYVAIFAALADTGKMLFTWGGVTLLALYLLNFGAPLWKPLTYLAPLSPFKYYEPMKLLMGAQVGVGKALIILAVSVTMFIIGGWLFNRRDISAG